MAKDKAGNIVPWNPSGARFEDGSIQSDLPIEQLGEFFGVNHFVVSQTNPHIIPFMKSTPGRSGFFSSCAAKFGVFLQQELSHRYRQICELGIIQASGSGLINSVLSIATQKYFGNITITPTLPWITGVPTLLSNPTLEVVSEYSHIGEKSTWPKLAIVRIHCNIELCLTENIRILREEKLGNWVPNEIMHAKRQHDATSGVPAQQDNRMKRSTLSTGNLRNSYDMNNHVASAK